MKIKISILSSIILVLLFLGCTQESDETNDSKDNNFTILRGTVPGTLIEAFCDNGVYFSTHSVHNGTNKHPFELKIAKEISCRLIMTTNEKSENEKIVTPIRFVTSEVNSSLFQTIESTINLGYIDLALDRANIIDVNGDGVSDEPLDIHINDGLLNLISELSSSSQSSSLISSSSSNSVASSSASQFSSISSLANSVVQSSSVVSLSSSSSDAVFVSSSSASASSVSTAISYTEYNSTKVYNVGDRVMYNGIVYEAKWWTQGEIPTDELGNASWKQISPIETYLQYQDSKIYEVGDRVMYNGIVYEAKWWTQFEAPSDLADGAWKRV